MKKITSLFIGVFLLSWLPSIASTAEITYYHTDALGTPLAMTDSTGKVVWRGDYYPFGEEYLIEQTPVKNKRHFTGKEKDEESGLHYFGARYMDEASGRFISPDPITFVNPETSETNTTFLENPLRLNRYVYGLNNPYRYIDPDGNIPILAAALIGGAVAYLSNPDVANAPASFSSKTFQSHGEKSIAAGVLGGTGLKTGIGVAANLSNSLKSADQWSRSPKSIQDQMTLEAARKGAGERIIKNLGDSRFKGMDKWRYKVKSSEGKTSVVHYVKDPKTEKSMDFKFKKHSID